MTENNIKAVVKETVNELLSQDMLKYSDLIIYERMSDRLREHYKTPETSIDQALDQLKYHPYYEVLQMYYGDNMTLEEIAEDYDVDISTIVRNKKSLCIKIFNLIN